MRRAEGGGVTRAHAVVAVDPHARIPPPFFPPLPP